MVLINSLYVINRIFFISVIFLTIAFFFLCFLYKKHKQTYNRFYTGTQFACKAYISIIVCIIIERVINEKINSVDIFQSYRLILASFLAIFTGSSLCVLNKDLDANPKRTNIETICVIFLGIAATLIILYFPQHLKTLKIIQIFVTLYLIVQYLIFGFIYVFFGKKIAMDDKYYVSGIWVFFIIAFGLISMSNVLFLDIIPKKYFIGIMIFNNLYFLFYGGSYFFKSYQFLVLTQKSATITIDLPIPVTHTQNKQRVYINHESNIEQGLEAFVENKGYLDANINLDDLAAQIRSNRSYVSSYINDKYDMTYSTWINYQRVQESKRLLMNNRKYTLDEVAQQCGFSSKNYYITIFSKFENETPTNWKNRQLTLR